MASLALIYIPFYGGYGITDSDHGYATMLVLVLIPEFHVNFRFFFFS